jgi:hypothetical protein
MRRLAVVSAGYATLVAAFEGFVDFAGRRDAASGRPDAPSARLRSRARSSSA